MGEVKVTGKLGYLREDQADHRPLHPTVEVGMFVRAVDGTRQKFQATTVRCPYCRRPMWESVTPIARVKFMPSDGAILTDPLPPTHRALVCGVCKQTFVAPRLHDSV